MAFAGFSIFFTLTGLIALQLIVRFNVVLDAVSFAFILYNFAVRARRFLMRLAPGSSKREVDSAFCRHSCGAAAQSCVSLEAAAGDEGSHVLLALYLEHNVCDQTCLCMQQGCCLCTQTTGTGDSPVVAHSPMEGPAGVADMDPGSSACNGTTAYFFWPMPLESTQGLSGCHVDGLAG